MSQRVSRLVTGRLETEHREKSLWKVYVQQRILKRRLKEWNKKKWNCSGSRYISIGNCRSSSCSRNRIGSCSCSSSSGRSRSSSNNNNISIDNCSRSSISGYNRRNISRM